MNSIKLYRAGFPRGFPGDTFRFESLAELRALIAIQAFENKPGFSKLSVCRDRSRPTLMGENVHGWEVIGYLEKDLRELPSWQYRSVSFVPLENAA